MKIIALVCSVLLVSAPLHAADNVKWNADQRAVLSAMETLHATTAPDGDGADAYGAVLDNSFSRWTIGSERINRKTEWVEGVRGWFDDGWRVQDRQSEIIEIDIRGDFAFTRRLVDEVYVGPEGDTSKSSAALAEVWTRSGGGWRLAFVNVHPKDAD